MDSLTQVVLGAAVGEYIAGRQMGNKAVLWGAVAGTIPDLDIIFAPLLDDIGIMLYHRSFSHSILFFLVAAPGLAWLASRRSEHPRRLWRRLYFWGMFTHALLDAFTVFGTQLLWPFSTYGFAFNTIFIIDPVYTLPMLISILIILWLKREGKWRRRIANIGLGISTVYLFLTGVNKKYVNSVFLASWESQGVQVEEYMSNPAPFSNFLWYGLARDSSGQFHYGLYSLLDKTDQVEFLEFSSDVEAEKRFVAGLNKEEQERFADFREKAKGFHLVRSVDGQLLYKDMRFGYINDWNVGEGDWAFTYEMENVDGFIQVQTKQSEPDGGMNTINKLAFRIMGK